MVLLFVLLRFLFKLLFNYRISILLRPFSFLVYLCPLLLDGNLQYVFFIMFSQGYLGFSLNPKDKILTVSNSILSFLALWFSIITCFLAYYIYKKLSKYVLDNWRTKVKGLLSYSLSNAVRLLILGFIHCFFRFNWDLQLKLLMIVEGLFIIFLGFILKARKMHKAEFKVWFNIIFSLLRFLLQLILYLQQFN